MPRALWKKAGKHPLGTVSAGTRRARKKRPGRHHLLYIYHKTGPNPSIILHIFEGFL